MEKAQILLLHQPPARASPSAPEKAGPYRKRSYVAAFIHSSVFPGGGPGVSLPFPHSEGAKHKLSRTWLSTFSASLLTFCSHENLKLDSCSTRRRGLSTACPWNKKLVFNLTTMRQPLLCVLYRALNPRRPREQTDAVTELSVLELPPVSFLAKYHFWQMYL